MRMAVRDWRQFLAACCGGVLKRKREKEKCYGEEGYKGKSRIIEGRYDYNKGDAQCTK